MDLDLVSVHVYEEDLRERHRFIGKVFCIVLLLIFVTVIQTVPVLVFSSFKEALNRHALLVYIPIVIYIALMFVCAFFPKTRELTPFNYVILLITVESLTMIVMFFTAERGNEAFLFGFSAAAVVCIILSFTALVCKVDLRKFQVLLTMIAVLTLFFIAIGLTILYFMPLCIFSAAVTFLCIALISAYFFFQIQELIHGRYKDISNQDYLYTALILYTDFMALAFLFMSIFRMKKI